MQEVYWLDQQSASGVWLSSITLAEIGYGLRILPAGQRRQLLQLRFERFIAAGFMGRILAFDPAAARIYPEIMALRREQGRPMSWPDGQIAAIAQVNALALATRNEADFVGCGLRIINPFES